MMGSKARVFAPIRMVTLEELVPPDHFYRHLESSLDLSSAARSSAKTSATWAS
jgi:hypothetical protein